MTDDDIIRELVKLAGHTEELTAEDVKNIRRKLAHNFVDTLLDKEISHVGETKCGGRQADAGA